MSTPFVTFPGTSGNYCFTEDVNLLDADTAHLVQSVGQWLGTNATLTDDGVQADGWGQFTIELTGATGRANIINQNIPIPNSGATHVFSFTVNNRQAGSRDLNVQIYVDGGQATSQILTVPAGESRQSITATLTGTDITHLWLLPTNDETLGDEWSFSKLVVAEGSDATFVPSLRIVGDLDLRAKAAPDDATPSASQYLFNMSSGSDGYGMYLHTDGKIYVVYGDGSTNREDASDALTWTDGDTHELQYTMDVSAGATAFYFDGTAAGTGTETVAAGSPAALDLIVGGATGTTSLFDGNIYYVEVRDGIDGPVVARFDAADVARALS